MTEIDDQLEVELTGDAARPQVYQHEAEHRGLWRKRWRRHRLGALGFLLVGFVAFAAILGPLLNDTDPNKQSIRDRLVPLLSKGKTGKYFLLGSDALGRDQLARVLYGARNSLTVVMLAVLLAATFGVILGSLAGYFGGALDNVVMRIVDSQLALPTLIMAMLVSATLGGGYWYTALTLGIASWPIYARLMRAEALKIREEDYIQAAVALGSGNSRIISRHVIPNLISSFIVIASLETGRLILIESSLSFLGFGLQPPAASLGSMIRSGQDQIFSAWWISAVPGVFIMITVLGLNVVGDWLRDVLDPRMR